jgi:hypothetical protein
MDFNFIETLLLFFKSCYICSVTFKKHSYNSFVNQDQSTLFARLEGRISIISFQSQVIFSFVSSKQYLYNTKALHMFLDAK